MGQSFIDISVNEQVQLFTQFIQNIMSNYILHETKTCDDKNSAWIDEKIKKIVLCKNHTYNANARDRHNADIFNKFQSLQAY